MKRYSTFFVCLGLPALLACGSKPPTDDSDTNNTVDTNSDTNSDTDTDTDTTTTSYTMGSVPTGFGEATMGEILGDVFFTTASATLQSFSFSHEPTNCSLDFMLLRRTEEPVNDGQVWWLNDWEAMDVTTGADSSNSGTIDIELLPDTWYAVAIHINTCRSASETLEYPVQRNANGPADVGVGIAKGYIRGNKEVESTGSLSGLVYKSKYLGPYQMTLNLSGL